MPVHVSFVFVCGFAGWVCIVRIWYDGQPFDYAYDSGPALISEDQARARAERGRFEEQGMECFLKEVYLGDNVQ